MVFISKNNNAIQNYNVVYIYCIIHKLYDFINGTKIFAGIHSCNAIATDGKMLGA